MSQDIFQRTELLIGSSGLNKLVDAHILVVGVGGVGAFAAEFVARAGVGKMTLVDGDSVDITNRNRQLLALESTTKRRKVEVMKERLLDINPAIELECIDRFILSEDVSTLLQGGFDFVIDAIDSVATKCQLIYECQQQNIALVSSMGAAGRLAHELIEVAKLEKTHHCGLAKAVRNGVKKLGGHTKTVVVFSGEEVASNLAQFSDVNGGKRVVPGTVSYMPATFGGACASVCIRHLLEIKL